MEKRKVKNDIFIEASAEKVWDALVNPEKTKIYMFGCEAISDWKVGSPLLWRGSYEGKEMVFVKGIILEILPPYCLKYTVIDPNSGMEDIPANYLNVTYLVNAETVDGKVGSRLIVIQDGFEGAADGEKRYQDVYNKGDGWNPILKSIAEVVISN